MRTAPVSGCVTPETRAWPDEPLRDDERQFWAAHLRELYRFGHGLMHEPFAGGCRAGSSKWVSQPQILHDFRSHDGSPTWHDLFALNTPLPWPQPREGDYAPRDGFVYCWYRRVNDRHMITGKWH